MITINTETTETTENNCSEIKWSENETFSVVSVSSVLIVYVSIVSLRRTVASINPNGWSVGTNISFGLSSPNG